MDLGDSLFRHWACALIQEYGKLQMSPGLIGHVAMGKTGLVAVHDQRQEGQPGLYNRCNREIISTGGTGNNLALALGNRLCLAAGRRCGKLMGRSRMGHGSGTAAMRKGRHHAGELKHPRN